MLLTTWSIYVLLLRSVCSLRNRSHQFLQMDTHIMHKLVRGNGERTNSEAEVLSFCPPSNFGFVLRWIHKDFLISRPIASRWQLSSAFGRCRSENADLDIVKHWYSRGTWTRMIPCSATLRVWTMLVVAQAHDEQVLQGKLFVHSWGCCARWNNGDLKLPKQRDDTSR